MSALTCLVTVALLALPIQSPDLRSAATPSSNSRTGESADVTRSPRPTDEYAYTTPRADFDHHIGICLLSAISTGDVAVHSFRECSDRIEVCVQIAMHLL